MSLHVAIQSFSCVRLLVTPWTAARQASLSITNPWSLLKLISIELVMPSNHLILCHTLLRPSSVFPSIRVFSMNQFFTSGGESIGVSASASVIPMNIQVWFPLGLTDLIILLSKGFSRVFTLMAISKSDYLPNPHILTPISLHWELGFQHMNLGVGDTSSP